MSNLTLDFTNCLAGTIGATHGLTDAEIDTLVAKFPKHHENIEEVRSSGESGFFELPYQDPAPLLDLVKKCKGFDHLVVLGVGGATIAPYAVFRALITPFWNQLDSKTRGGAPQVHFLQNPDPLAINDLAEALDPKKTLYYLITKSGNTAESNAIYLWLDAFLKKKVGKNALTRHLILATDPGKSPLAELAAKEKCEVVAIPTNLSDRFNVLGHASIFPVALCGLDVSTLLAGAADMDKRCRHPKAMENPAYMHSLIHYLLTRKRRKTIHAMMVFANRLDGFVDWYSHLLSVSLGKMLNKKGKAVHVGPGPAQCLGPSGCYGQMQLYQEGPFDKVTTLVAVSSPAVDAEIPAAPPKVEAISYLGGTTFNTLVDQAYVGAAQVMTSTGRPNLSIILDDVTPATLGGLVYMLQLSTAMSAELYGIDAFNQPGIDLNKQAVFAQLGRPGFEDKAAVLSQYRSRAVRTC